MASIQQPPPSPEALRQGYEPESLRFRGVVVFVVCFVLASGAVAVVLWILFRGLLTWDRPSDPAPSSLAGLPRQPSAAPPLQPSGPAHDTLPEEDLAELHRREDAVFERMGWKRDSASPTVEIPDRIVAAVQMRESTSRSAPGGLPPVTQPVTGKGGQP